MFFHFLPWSHWFPGDWVTMSSLAPLTFSIGMLYSCISHAVSSAAARICSGVGVSVVKLPATAMLMPSAIHGCVRSTTSVRLFVCRIAPPSVIRY
ncbi:MAG: hypothetical protein BWY52_02945 [Chloroflexi bacterium ADurb.Bin325]|nr:MAG: hypothetical protein BWY52_02945 [Chloroflexi bacterium ADurb.Bin325]